MRFVHQYDNGSMKEKTPTDMIVDAIYEQGLASQEMDKSSPSAIKAALLKKNEIGKTTQLMNEYKRHLDSMGYTKRTINGRLFNVASFYKKHKVILEVKMSIKNVETSIPNRKPPELEMLINFFKNLNLRNKCIMGIGLSSGLARADIVTLTVGEFKRGCKTYIDDEGNEIQYCVLNRQRHKSEVQHHTFISPETCGLIDQYIQWRNNPNITRHQLIKIYSDDDALFIHDALKPKYVKSVKYDTQGNVITYDDSIRAISGHTISHLYIRMNESMGMEKNANGFYPIRSHNMRRYFSNIMKSSYVKEHFMGHKGKDSITTYENFEEDEALAEYMKYIDDLTMLDKVIISSSTAPSMKKMKMELDEEKARNLENEKRIARLELMSAKAVKPRKKRLAEYQSDVSAQEYLKYGGIDDGEPFPDDEGEITYHTSMSEAERKELKKAMQDNPDVDIEGDV
ncbi:hypothetical protein Mpsy_0621 [Methanolobus psychrophilus R15]|nr:hypothetical protein Mpsy_0621 [Methanolobus psychrophilus R15]